MPAKKKRRWSPESEAIGELASAACMFAVVFREGGSERDMERARFGIAKAMAEVSSEFGLLEAYEAIESRLGEFQTDD